MLFKTKIILIGYQNIWKNKQYLKIGLMLCFRIKMGWAFLTIA